MDVLLTDYSGVYCDFLLTHKPIIFTAFDLDYYSESRGLNFDYKASISGPIANNWEDVIIHLEKFFSEKNSLYGTNLINEKNLYFNGYNDGQSSEKLYNEIIKKIK